MHREELLQWVTELGNEFVRRGMHGHAQRLRVYFLALEKHLLPRNLDLEVHWTKNMVLDWMKTLRLAPFENALAVRPAGGAAAGVSGPPPPFTLRAPPFTLSPSKGTPLQAVFDRLRLNGELKGVCISPLRAPNVSFRAARACGVTTAAPSGWKKTKATSVEEEVRQ